MTGDGWFVLLNKPRIKIDKLPKGNQQIIWYRNDRTWEFVPSLKKEWVINSNTMQRVVYIPEVHQFFLIDYLPDKKVRYWRIALE